MVNRRDLLVGAGALVGGAVLSPIVGLLAAESVPPRTAPFAYYVSGSPGWVRLVTSALRAFDTLDEALLDLRERCIANGTVAHSGRTVWNYYTNDSSWYIDSSILELKRYVTASTPIHVKNVSGEASYAAFSWNDLAKVEVDRFEEKITALAGWEVEVNQKRGLNTDVMIYYQPADHKYAARGSVLRNLDGLYAVHPSAPFHARIARFTV